MGCVTVVATPTATPLVEKRQSAYANGEVEIGDTVAVAASASSIDLGMAKGRSLRNSVVLLRGIVSSLLRHEASVF